MAQASCWTMPTNVLRFLRYLVLKGSGQMCSAAFITLGCVLCVEMIIVITRWKAADEILSLPLMSYPSAHARCRVHRFCFWMIYCGVKVAYVLLKLMLVNDREYVLNNLIATGAVFSHLQLWEHVAHPAAVSPAGTSGAGCLGASVFTLGCSRRTFLKKCNWTPTLISLSRRHNCSFCPPYSVDERNRFT